MIETVYTTVGPAYVAADPEETLRITARRHGRDLVVLTAQGEIDLANTWLLDSELARYEDVPRLVVDMSNVRFCAVTGARLLHTAVIRSAVTGQRLEIVDNAAVSRLLTMTGLADGVPRLEPAELAYEQAERNLCEYARRVAVAAGSGPESTVSELEPDPVLYIALSSPCAAFPARDAALLWNARHGWAVAIETTDRDDKAAGILDYLGPDLFADPPVVARFAAGVLARPAPVPPGPPPGVVAGDLLARLRVLGTPAHAKG
jgi:anti-anti-sigma factor